MEARYKVVQITGDVDSRGTSGTGSYKLSSRTWTEVMFLVPIGFIFTLKRDLFTLKEYEQLS